MKKVFLLLAMVGLAFASCEPNGGKPTGGNEDSILGAGEFEISVSNVGENSADLKITPKQEGRTFYWNIATDAELAEFATTAAFMEDYYNYLASAVEEGVSTWDKILDAAPVEYTTQKLDPNTKYNLFAFGIDVNGNLTSADITYVKFQTKESTFDVSKWYGYWEVTSPKQVQIGNDPMTGQPIEEIVDESYTTILAVVPGDDLKEGEAYVYGFDGIFGLEMPAVGSFSSNSLKMINEYLLFEEETDYGPCAYSWNGHSFIESFGAFYVITGNYAPYTFTMAADGSTKVTAYQGQISTGDVFTTDFYRLDNVITSGENEGASFIYTREDGLPAVYLNGAEMTATYLGALEEATAHKLSKKAKAVNKMATPRAAAKKFSSAVKFAK